MKFRDWCPVLCSLRLRGAQGGAALRRGEPAVGAATANVSQAVPGSNGWVSSRRGKSRLGEPFANVVPFAGPEAGEGFLYRDIRDR